MSRKRTQKRRKAEDQGFRFQVQDSTPNRQRGRRKAIAAKAKTFLHELRELTRIGGAPGKS
jgi:hypothetical protein